jgi:hypothetical protein
MPPAPLRQRHPLVPGCRAFRVDGVETRGQGGELDGDIREEGPGRFRQNLDQPQNTVAIDIRLGFTQHHFTHRIQADPHRQPGQTIHYPDDVVGVFFRQKQARQLAHAAANREGGGGFGTQGQRPSPGTPQLQAPQIGVEMVGDGLRGFQLRQNIDEAKQAGTHVLVAQGPGNQAPAQVARGEQVRLPATGIQGESLSDLPGLCFQTLCCCVIGFHSNTPKALGQISATLPTPQTRDSYMAIPP